MSLPSYHNNRDYHKKVGVLRFLGTNCDRDVWQALEAVGKTPSWMWYKDRYDWQDFSAIIIPGGFSYGDYLRAGALAAKSPAMASVIEAAQKGLPILGICNGFQILCDCGLLPGTLLQNKNLNFIDKWLSLKLINTSPAWGGALKKDDFLRLPIAHKEGCYYLKPDGLKSLQDNEQVWLEYENNPNGSLKNIAGILNTQKNVAGLMPHPERAMFSWMGGVDGWSFF